MVKFLAFLVILVILFGLEATRAFIFGTLGFIFWIAVVVVGIFLLVNVLANTSSNNTPEPKKVEHKKPKEKFTLSDFWHSFWPFIIFAIVFGVLIALLIITAK